MNEEPQKFISQGLHELLDYLNLSIVLSHEASPPISQETLGPIEIEDIPQPTPTSTQTPFIDVRSPKFS